MQSYKMRDYVVIYVCSLLQKIATCLHAKMTKMGKLYMLRKLEWRS